MAIRSKGFRYAVLAVVLAVGLVALSRSNAKSAVGLKPADVDAAIKKAVDKAAKDAAAAPAKSVAVYQAILPSIVLVTATKAGLADKPDGTATGVIINDEGAILTSLSVVEGAASITATYSDGTTTKAVIETKTPEKDIAVLKVEELPGVVVPAVMGGMPRIGEEVFAVGHPFTLNNSLTAGVVSGTGRTFTLPGGKNIKIEDLIQFDAAVNPGNSGGPLLNGNGQVVGIVTGLINPNDEGLFIGIGFAVPIATAGGAAGGPPT